MKLKPLTIGLLLSSTFFNAHAITPDTYYYQPSLGCDAGGVADPNKPLLALTKHSEQSFALEFKEDLFKGASEAEIDYILSLSSGRYETSEVEGRGKDIYDKDYKVNLYKSNVSAKEAINLFFPMLTVSERLDAATNLRKKLEKQSDIVTVTTHLNMATIDPDQIFIYSFYTEVQALSSDSTLFVINHYSNIPKNLHKRGHRLFPFTLKGACFKRQEQS